MKLSDIMGAAHLSTYAEVALVIFMAVFFAVAFRVLGRGEALAWEEARKLPLEDGSPRGPGGQGADR